MGAGSRCVYNRFPLHEQPALDQSASTGIADPRHLRRVQAPPGPRQWFPAHRMPQPAQDAQVGTGQVGQGYSAVTPLDLPQHAGLVRPVEVFYMEAMRHRDSQS